MMKRIAELSPEKRAQLFAQLKQRQTGGVLPLDRIERQPRASNVFPVSFSQQRLWFLDQFEPASALYNIPEVVRIQGRLRPDLLQRTLDAITARHEALRTTFRYQDGAPVQVIEPDARITLARLDLRGQPEVATRQLIHDEARRPFDLERGPLLRATLAELDETSSLLLLTMHHIVSDGWSLGVLIAEIAALYQTYAQAGDGAAGSDALPELPIQYADFAVWQRQRLTPGAPGAILEQQMDYWRRQLADIPRLALPTDRVRPAIQTHQGATLSLVLPASLADALRTLSQRAGCSLFITMLAAFKVVLMRSTGQTDLAVGSIIANRNRAELEGLVGCFVNTLVLRSDLADAHSFRDALTQVRETALQAYAHQDMPFEKLVDELQPVRDLSHAPLFQTLFVMQNTPSAPAAVADVAFSRIEADTRMAKFDLSLYVTEQERGLHVLAEYAADLFDAATITRLLDQYQRVLTAVSGDPDIPIGRLELLSESERQQLLIGWNATAQTYPDAACVHDLFEAQAQRTPDAVAIVDEQTAITYRELNARANQLARHLRALGVRAETLVGVCVERGVMMATALLGVLKAGGAYVPLDPNYPAERLALVMQDAQMAVLLTQTRLRERLPDRVAHVVCLDRDWDAVAEQPADALSQVVSPDNLAYAIYTSGSTGTPKGVQVEHRSVVNFLHAMRREPGLTSRDTFLAVTSISFDIAALELFLPLIVGARLVIVSRETAGAGEELAARLRDERVTAMQATPATWQLLLGAGWRGSPDLSALCGGEALPRELANQLLACSAALWNMYGPTETTIWSAVLRVTPGAGSVPIGRPIANTQLYVLDAWLQPAPIGVAGELYIGGAGVTRGYVGQPALTAERFIPNPFLKAEGGEMKDEESGLRLPPSAFRLYRTGDLVRYLPDGTIEFLGRIDQQVKIRGYRIELQEIETALVSHALIREAVVVAREDTPGTKRLVAYVVPGVGDQGSGLGDEPANNGTSEQANKASDGDPSAFILAPSSLRQFLAQRLPEYMIPAIFVPLDALPLTPNGKVNRKALPAPDLRQPQLERAFVAPESEHEIALAKIWADALGVGRVGVHDNFFELGGDSLLVIRVVALANQAGLKLTTKQLFQRQTIGQLAEAVGTSEILAEQGLVSGLSPLTPSQHHFFELQYQNHNHFSIALVLQTQETLAASAWSLIVERLLQRHDALRLHLTVSDGERALLHGSPDVNASFTTVDLSTLPEAEHAARIAAALAQQQLSLDMTAGALFRIVLFQDQPRRPDRLLLLCHHLVADVFSWQIILADLENAARQVREGQPIQLPAKTTAFKQWAERLEAHAQAGRYQRDLDYWLREPQTPVAALPLDHPDGRNTFASTSNVVVSLSAAETHALLHELPAAYATQTDELLLMALSLTLAEWSGSPSLRINVIGHGRALDEDDIDLSRTVGWINVIYPVLLEIAPADRPSEVLRTVQRALQQVPNRGLSYGILRYLSRDRALAARMPHGEIVLNHVGQLFNTRSTFQPIGGGSGHVHDPQGIRPYPLAVNATLDHQQLNLVFEYSANLHERATIEALAARMAAALQALLAEHQRAAPVAVS
jgi:amino acid adenylation domain-containing protein/non-ribosomal peptide synthase protein (TIGR01720 family)